MPDLLEGGQCGSAGSSGHVGALHMQRRRGKEAHLRRAVPGKSRPQLDDLIGVVAFRGTVSSALDEIEIHVPARVLREVRTDSEDVKPARRVGGAGAHAGDTVESSTELEGDVGAG